MGPPGNIRKLYSFPRDCTRLLKGFFEPIRKSKTWRNSSTEYLRRIFTKVLKDTLQGTAKFPVGISQFPRVLSTQSTNAELNILKMSIDISLLEKVQKVLSLCTSANFWHPSAPPPYLFIRTIPLPRAELSELPQVICNIKNNLKSSLSLNKNSAAII